MRFGQTLHRAWPFIVKGKPPEVVVSGDRVADDGALVRNWCLAGHGIALKSVMDIARDLKDGTLVKALPKFATPTTQLQIIYPQAAVMPRRVRLLIEMIEKASYTKCDARHTFDRSF